MSAVSIAHAVEGRACPIHVGPLGPFPVGDASGLAVVHDAALSEHTLHELVAWAKGGHAPVTLLSRAAGEGFKDLSAWQDLLSAFAACRLDRRGVVVAAGGGSLLDCAGFAAACWLRGVRWIAVPTTLLAMVDASIGGKTAVNFGARKNLVGAFHLPAAVLVDPSFLASLPAAESRGGWSEILKSALIGDAALFDAFRHAARGPDTGGEPSADTLVRAIGVKARIVERDFQEAGERGVLNLGHTLAHALEAAEIPPPRHGDAVAVGLAFSARVAQELGLLAPEWVREVHRVLEAWRLPRAWDPRRTSRLLDAIAADKKHVRGRWCMALLREPGWVELHQVEPALVERVLHAGP